MDLLKAEIARKKKQIEESEVLGPEKKYFKRGDLAAKQEAEYWKKHKRLRLVEEAEDSNDSEAEFPKDPEKGDQKEHKMPANREVIRRLRDRGEPIRLYGESDYDVYKRMKHLEMTQPELEKGFRNDYKAAMDQVDQQYLHDILQNGAETKAEGSGDVDVKVIDDGITFNEIIKLSENLQKGDENVDSEVVLRYFKLVLAMWGNELNQRNPEEKRSFSGKLASATHSQTVTYIKPLFRKLKKREMSIDILDCLAEIVKYLLAKHYLKANDSYLEMAIGNAPWPIGVTMVGIHARTGREKIFSRNVAHVLNDETQRKYIQAVKRLMTQGQKFFPTDPSYSVNYVSLHEKH